MRNFYAHAEMSGATQMTGIATTPIILTSWDSVNEQVNASASSANNIITANFAREYTFDFGISFSGTVSVRFTFMLYRDPLGGGSFAQAQDANSNDILCVRTLGAGGDSGHTALTGDIKLAATDEIAIYVVANSGSGRQITPNWCFFGLKAS